jgi:hypothetical protein
MKFTLTFKQPDVFDQLDDLSEEERDSAERLARDYVQYSEYINVEFDTEAGTAKAVKLR